MRHTRRGQCTDPRDRVYALLGMLHPREAEAIKPDYSKSVLQTYEEVVMIGIEHTRTLDILGACSLQESQIDWPSWVPHFDVVSSCSDLPCSVASGVSAAEVDLDQSGVLRAVGKRVDSVKRCIRLPSIGGSDFEVIEAVREVVADQDLSELSHTGTGSTFDTCCRVLYVNYDELRREVVDSAAISNFMSRKEALRDLLLECDANSISLEFRPWIWNRTLTTSTHDLIGLAPQEVQVGDEICIMLGCDMPILLRALRGGKYQVVGEGFFEALADAEWLLGPLPENWQNKRRMDRHGRSWQAFLNPQSQQLTKEDPRLGALPVGWSTIPHDQDEYVNLFYNVQTGQSTFEDPRLTSEELKKRDIELEELNLV